MGRDTKEQILKEGIALVTEKGFHSTGISEILRAAAVPKGSFYHYFPSKTDFGVEMIEAASRDFLEELRSYCTREEPPLDRLKIFLDDQIARYERTPCRCNCLFGKLSQEISDDSPALGEKLTEMFDRWTALIAGLLSEARSEGTLPPEASPDTLARFILSGWEGAVMLSRVRGSVAPLKEFREILFSFLQPEQNP